MIYNRVCIYRLVMRVLYRGKYLKKYSMVAEQIEPGGTVLDLCCGDCVLERLLTGMDCSYIGLDNSGRPAVRMSVNTEIPLGRTLEEPQAQTADLKVGRPNC